jgi:hypothetical protein
MLKCPSDIAMKTAGWSETHGIALWTNPAHKGVLIDTNAEIVSVFPRGADQDDAGEELDNADALNCLAEEKAMRRFGLPCEEYVP